MLYRPVTLSLNAAVQAQAYPPPLIPGSVTQRKYANTVDNTTNPSIFVTYNDHQAYPAYIVMYSDGPNQSAQNTGQQQHTANSHAQSTPQHNHAYPARGMPHHQNNTRGTPHQYSKGRHSATPPGAAPGCCFICHLPGHFASACPLRPRSSSITAPTCSHCHISKVQKTVSKRSSNQGRLFWVCPNDCPKSFQWDDDIVSSSGPTAAARPTFVPTATPQRAATSARNSQPPPSGEVPTVDLVSDESNDEGSDKSDSDDSHAANNNVNKSQSDSDAESSESSSESSNEDSDGTRQRVSRKARNRAKRRLESTSSDDDHEGGRKRRRRC